jgi:hypothetical protein
VEWEEPYQAEVIYDRYGDYANALPFMIDDCEEFLGNVGYTEFARDAECNVPCES